MNEQHADLRLDYAPVKFGFLGAEMGPTLAKAYRQIHNLAFEEGYRQSWLPRRVDHHSPETAGRTDAGVGD